MRIVLRKGIRCAMPGKTPADHHSVLLVALVFALAYSLSQDAAFAGHDDCAVAQLHAGGPAPWRKFVNCSSRVLPQERNASLHGRDAG